MWVLPGISFRYSRGMECSDRSCGRLCRWAEELTYPDELILTTLCNTGERPGGGFLQDNWRVIDKSIILGMGPGDYHAVSERLMTWRAHESAGVGVGSWRPATTDDVVRVRFAGTDSPCLILCAEVDELQTRLVYGTLPGHVECGEEAFAITLGPDGTVRGRITAFSRHAWLPARLAAPLARSVQNLITDRYLEGMRP